MEVLSLAIFVLLVSYGAYIHKEVYAE